MWWHSSIIKTILLTGVIVTQYDHRRLIDREVLESLTAAFPGKVFQTTISNSVALVEAPSYGKDIFKYKPNSKPAASNRRKQRGQGLRLR